MVTLDIESARMVLAAQPMYAVAEDGARVLSAIAQGSVLAVS